MKPVPGFVFLLSLALCLFFSPSLTKADGNNSELVSDVCSRSESKNLCLSSLASNPDSQKAKPTELAIIALRLASANATDTSLFIKKTLNRTDLEPAVEDSLEDCSKNYVDAVEQLDNSLAALLADAYNDLHDWVNAAISEAEECKKEFEGHAEKLPELIQRNNNLIQLSKIVLIVNSKLSDS